MILKENTLNGVKLEDLKYEELFKLIGILEISVISPIFFSKPTKAEIISHIKRLRNVLNYTNSSKGEYLCMVNLTNKELIKELNK